MLYFLKPLLTERAKPWFFRVRFLGRAKLLWNALALHLSLEGTTGRGVLFLSIPGLLSLVWAFPVRIHLTWITTREYGFFHDFFETKLQWGKCITCPGVGFEKRVVRDQNEATIVRTITPFNCRVNDLAESWAAGHQFDSWELTMIHQEARSRSLLVPKLFDYGFTLTACRHGNVVADVRYRPVVPYHGFATEAFLTLSTIINGLRP